jgi:hypothetical protein
VIIKNNATFNLELLKMVKLLMFGKMPAGEIEYNFS